MRMAALLGLASLMLAPALMALDLKPMPGDIDFTLNQHHYQLPVLWSLCAGAGLALFYSVLKK
jgi:hypothetical protein